MDFIEVMKDAMDLLHQACAMNEEWVACQECPFEKYCDVLKKSGLGTPDEDTFFQED